MERYTWTLYLIEVFRKYRRFEGDGNTPEPPAEEPALRDLQGESGNYPVSPGGVKSMYTPSWNERVFRGGQIWLFFVTEFLFCL